MSDRREKILLLGGSYAQLPAIKAAKNRGLYSIVCDYLPNNPGQNYADEYVSASTTDKEAVLKIARDMEVDYIFAYASDPAAPTAAYVSEKLGLPGNSYESVKVLSEKHLFRKLIKDCSLNCPDSLSLTEDVAKRTKSLDLAYPLIVKPVDSSGSKGVKLIEKFSEFSSAADYAFSFSRSKQIIVEEFIPAKGAQLHGDGFISDGELVFCYLGDHHYNNAINSFVPYSTTWPSQKNEGDLKRIYNDVGVIIKKSGFKNGPINIEARITEENKIYIMELGPRSGGNFVPQLLKYATGFDMIEEGLNVAMGKEVIIPKLKKESVAYYVLHTKSAGLLSHITVSPELSAFVKETHLYVKKGEKVQSFQGANAAIGILLLVFPDAQVMNQLMNQIDRFINIKVD